MLLIENYLGKIIKNSKVRNQFFHRNTVFKQIDDELRDYK